MSAEVAGELYKMLTFIAIFFVYLEVEVGTISKARDADDFTFEIPNIGMRAVDGYTLGLLLRLELEIHVGSHDSGRHRLRGGTFVGPAEASISAGDGGCTNDSTVLVCGG